MNINETQGSGDSLNVTKTPRIEPKNTKKDSFWWEFVKYALIAVFIILPIRMYVIQPFIVSGQSMEYTFDSGEYLLDDEISYRFNNPQRGDVIVFKYPNASTAKSQSEYSISVNIVNLLLTIPEILSYTAKFPLASLEKTSLP